MITADSLRVTMQKNRALIRGYGDESKYAKKLKSDNQSIGYALAYMKKYHKLAARDMEEVMRLAELFREANAESIK